MVSDDGWTPGPWVVNPLCAQVECGIVSKLGGMLPVCQLLWPTDERGEAETEANARPIASAPELAEALRIAAECFRTYEQLHLAKDTDEARDKAVSNGDMAALCEAALAKAKGQYP